MQVRAAVPRKFSGFSWVVGLSVTSTLAKRAERIEVLGFRNVALL